MFSQLIAHSANAQSLSDFISKNQALIDDFIDSDNNIQRQQSDLFEQFVLLDGRIQILDSLDFSKSQNRAFITILFDYAERVNASAVIVQLFQIIQKHNLDIGSRLEATMLYLFNVPNNQVYVDRFEDICSKLQTAIDEEDDNDNKAIATFLNYYSSTVINTAPHIQFAQSIQVKYQSLSDSYPFLQKDIIKSSLSLDINQAELVYSTIQATIDELLGKKNNIANSLSRSDFIIETDTEYSRILSNVPKTVAGIRDIAVSQIEAFQNKDEIFYSLGRGVTILEQEGQLFSYLNSYGLMHKAKLVSAFSHFPFGRIEGSNIEVFDWGCGQGMASIVLLEYQKEQALPLKINRITLIEPSEIALKRASLHVRHLAPEIEIKTILKEFDSLTEEDVISSNNKVKLHLFSNILDVEAFSMQQLIDLINLTQKGTNFFVCVSPYINDVKTARFDSFARGFRHEVSFNILYQDEARRGEWKKTWTKLIKVFRVELT